MISKVVFPLATIAMAAALSVFMWSLGASAVFTGMVTVSFIVAAGLAYLRALGGPDRI